MTVDNTPPEAAQQRLELHQTHETTGASNNWLVDKLKKAGHQLSRWTKNILYTAFNESFTVLGAITLPWSITAVASGAAPLWIAAGAIPHLISTIGGWKGGVNKASGREKFDYFMLKGLAAGTAALAAPINNHFLTEFGQHATNLANSAIMDKGILDGVNSAINTLTQPMTALQVGVGLSAASTLIGTRHNEGKKSH